MQEEESKKILHDIVSSVTGTDSFSESLVFLKNKNSGYMKTIRDDSFPLTMTASITEGNFCDELGIKEGTQKIAFIDFAAKMNIDVLKKATKKIIIDKLNDVWTKNEIKLTVKEDNLEEVIKLIGRIILLEKAKRIIRIIECWPEFLEILPYCNRYINMQEEDVLTEVENLVFSDSNLRFLIINKKEAKKEAIEALAKAGHPRITLETKTAGEMMTTIERMITAGNAVLKYRRIYPKMNPTKGQLMDQIAIYWFDEEEKGLENKTDFIVPPPE